MATVQPERSQVLLIYEEPCLRRICMAFMHSIKAYKQQEKEIMGPSWIAIVMLTVADISGQHPGWMIIFPSSFWPEGCLYTLSRLHEKPTRLRYATQDVLTAETCSQAWLSNARYEDRPSHLECEGRLGTRSRDFIRHSHLLRVGLVDDGIAQLVRQLPDADDVWRESYSADGRPAGVQIHALQAGRCLQTGGWDALDAGQRLHAEHRCPSACQTAAAGLHSRWIHSWGHHVGGVIDVGWTVTNDGDGGGYCAPVGQ